MLSEKKIYRHKGLMSNIFIPLIIVLTIINLVFKMESEYVFLTRIICFSIAALIFIISIVRVNNKDLGILQYVSIGYFYIAIVSFIELEYMWTSKKLA